MTKPDWTRRFSTLQSAHFPVRGHGIPARVLLLVVVSIVLDSDGGVLLAGADRPQLKIIGTVSAIEAQNLFIDCKDRPVDQAPRLLFT